jgi:hypothetical protein
VNDANQVPDAAPAGPNDRPLEPRSLHLYLNLVAPGAGLALLGRTGLGLLVGVAFSVAMNLAIIATLIVPDDFSAAARFACLAAAVVAYAAGQILMWRAIDAARAAWAQQRRREVLGRVQAALLEGSAEEAWRALAPLLERAESDLHIAYRVAQVLSHRGTVGEAESAWARVQRLDAHGIYREHTRGLSADRESSP